MSQAMQDLARDMARAAQDMEQGAQDLNHMSNEQLSDEQIADLRQQLDDLRQRMRQQNGQGGQEQRMRLQRFAGQARGGVMPGGMEPGGSHGRLRLALGGGGQGVPIPMGSQPGQGANGDPQGDGHEPGGTNAGTQHDEHIRGASTSIQTRNRTVAVQGQQRGNGTVRPQIIRTAAQEGFTIDGYRDVHAAYWEHAQQVVHAGDVPPGYRSYVRRYFQLIRPRDE
jgi:exonuclease VII large subunit